MKTTFQFLLATFCCFAVTFQPNKVIAQRQGNGIPDLTEEQRMEMKNSKMTTLWSATACLTGCVMTGWKCAKVRPATEIHTYRKQYYAFVKSQK